MAQAFTESCDLYLPALAAAETAYDWKQATHGLKGASRGIGAFRLGDLCEAAEQANTADNNVRTALLTQIRAAAAEAQSFLANRK